MMMMTQAACPLVCAVPLRPQLRLLSPRLLLHPLLLPLLLKVHLPQPPRQHPLLPSQHPCLLHLPHLA